MNTNVLSVGKFNIEFVTLYTPNFKKKVSKIVAKAEQNKGDGGGIDAQYDVIEPFLTKITDAENGQDKPFVSLLDSLSVPQFKKVVEKALEVCKDDPQIYETIALAWDLIDMEDAHYIQKKMKSQAKLNLRNM